jgi:hypothetical protein
MILSGTEYLTYKSASARPSLRPLDANIRVTMIVRQQGTFAALAA